MRSSDEINQVYTELTSYNNKRNSAFALEKPLGYRKQMINYASKLVILFLTTILFYFLGNNEFIYFGYQKSWRQEVFEKEQPILEHKNSAAKKKFVGKEHYK